MWRDASRDQLPPGKVWNLTDYIPDFEAPLRKRGGWQNTGSALDALDASAGNPAVVAVAPFTGGTQVLAIDDRANPELFAVQGASADRGSVYGAAAGLPLGPLRFYRDQVLIPSHDLDSSPVTPRKYVAAGTISDLTGAPGTRFFEVYKDRVAAASADTDIPNRIHFSAAGNAESWDTTNRWIDTSASPVALAALRNALLVFQAGSVERIRGDIPPGSAAANMVLEPLFNNIGIFGANSLSVTDDVVYFANDRGVYQTDGTSLVDLTKQGGISHYWRTQVITATKVALAAWRGWLLISMLSTDTYVDFLVFDTSTKAWFRFTNIKANNLVADGDEELYLSTRGEAVKRIGRFSDTLTPGVSYKNDIDGDAVTPVLETGIYDLNSTALKRWKQFYLAHDTRDAGTDNPTQTVSYLTDPAGTSYTALSPAFTETTSRDRKRRQISGPQSHGMAFKIAQTNASSDSRIYALEAEVEAKEGSRLRAA
jgi:hypothetical protein